MVERVPPLTGDVAEEAPGVVSAEATAPQPGADATPLPIGDGARDLTDLTDEVTAEADDAGEPMDDEPGDPLDDEPRDAALTLDDGSSSGSDLEIPAGHTVPLALPEKEYFKIGEVAEIVGVKPYVLRYWEAEFKRDIRPERTRTNQRMYRRRDIETFLAIKRLRYEEKLELPGARKRLRDDVKAARSARLASDADPSAAAAAGGPSGDERPRDPAIAGAALDRLEKGLREVLRLIDEDEKRG